MGITNGDFLDYSMQITFRTKNIGHTPARAMRIRVSYVIPRAPFSFELDKLFDKQLQTCIQPSSFGPFGWAEPGSTTFPDDQITESTVAVRINREEWPSEEIWTHAYLYLVGCVIYKVGKDSKDHHTAFAYRVEASDAVTFILPTDPTKIAFERTRLSQLRYSELLSAD